MTHERQTSLPIDRDRIKEVIALALNARENGEGLFKNIPTPPEIAFINEARIIGQTIGSEVYPLHAVFFLTMTLFADNSVRQLGLAARSIEFHKHAWIFRPEIVVKKSSSEVEEAANDLIRPGYNRTALPKWQHNAQVLIERYDGDLRNFFAENNFSAPQILDALVGPTKKTDWKGFHRFGPKLARLFLHWVDKYQLAKIENVGKIGGVVDFQAARLLIQTGGLPLVEPQHKARVLDQTLIPALDEIYEQVAEERGIPAYFIHETLWLIGSAGCNNYAHEGCPLGSVCTRLISRDPFDRQGLFDPTDTGRNMTQKGKFAQNRKNRKLALGQQELGLFRETLDKGY